LAFQIAFNAVCISPKTPDAVTNKVTIPTIVAMMPDDLLAAFATAVWACEPCHGLPQGHQLRGTGSLVGQSGAAIYKQLHDWRP
jgi:cytochrome c553